MEAVKGKPEDLAETAKWEAEKRLTVTRPSYWIPIQLTGKDEQGRQLYRCPNWGCGDETAFFDSEGRGQCPSCQPLMNRVTDLLREATKQLTGEGVKP
jgi:hypothetical protein